DVGDLLVEQARVDRMRNGAGAAYSVQTLQVPMRVPGQCRYAIALAHAEPLQGVREAFRAGLRAAPRVAMRRSFDRQGNDFALVVIERRVIDEFPDEQRPILDLAHVCPPRVMRRAAPAVWPASDPARSRAAGSVRT